MSSDGMPVSHPRAISQASGPLVTKHRVTFLIVQWVWHGLPELSNHHKLQHLSSVRHTICHLCLVTLCLIVQWVWDGLPGLEDHHEMWADEREEPSQALAQQHLTPRLKGVH